MSFTVQKAADLLESSNSLDVIIASADAEIAAFESMLNANVSSKCFYHIVETGEVDGDGYSAYKQIAWCYFAGPFPSGSAAGKHFILRTFKAKPAEIADETTYVNLVKEKVSALMCVDNKHLAISNFDAFLDAFKSEMDSKLA